MKRVYFNKWGKSYWKINNSLFNDKIYENLIFETLNNFNYSRPSREWEILKEEIKMISKTTAIQKAKDR